MQRPSTSVNDNISADRRNEIVRDLISDMQYDHEWAEEQRARYERSVSENKVEEDKPSAFVIDLLNID